MTDDAELSTPVALFAYDRPDATRRVVDRIAEAEPPAVYAVADGPRDDPAERERCAETRRVIRDADWECPVHTLFRESNVGLPEAVYTGLDWVFEREPEAIILEDDTVPSDSFFRFCETLLDRYRETPRVMMINGTNRLGTWRDDAQDYHFATYQDVWGWATWREAWDEYDPRMSAWADPSVRERIRATLDDDERYEYYAYRFQRSYDGISPAWSRMWRFAILANGGVCAIPSRNLITNVGFGPRAVHTTDSSSPLAALPRREVEFPLTGPSDLEPDREYERTCFERFRRPALSARVARRVRRRVASAAVWNRIPEPARRRFRSLVE
jgi:hypothetical protein